MVKELCESAHDVITDPLTKSIKRERKRMSEVHWSVQLILACGFCVVMAYFFRLINIGEMVALVALIVGCTSSTRIVREDEKTDVE